MLNGIDPVFIQSGIALIFFLVLQIALFLMGIGDFEIAESELDAPDMDADFDADMDADADMPSSGGIVDLLGLRGVPVIIWICSLLTGFTMSGFFFGGLLGDGLMTWPVRIVSVLLGFIFARYFSRMVAKLVPSIETSAVSMRSSRTLSGVVQEGIARKGHPARIRVKDKNGSLHYFMAEPQDEGAEFRSGEEVILTKEFDASTSVTTYKIISY